MTSSLVVARELLSSYIGYHFSSIVAWALLHMRNAGSFEVVVGGLSIVVLAGSSLSQFPGVPV